MKKIEIDPKEIMFPAPIEAWVVSYHCLQAYAPDALATMFPAPLEAWVVSYLWNDNSVIASDRVFPAPLEGWVGSYSRNGL